MKKKTRAVKSKRSHSRVVRIKKHSFLSSFPVRFSFVSVTILGCLALILGGTYHFLSSQGVLGANTGATKSSSNSIYISITVPTGKDALPSSEELVLLTKPLDKNGHAMPQNSYPYYTTTYYGAEKSGVHPYTLVNGYAYSIAAVIWNQSRGYIDAGYTAKMYFPYSNFPIGVPGQNLPCGDTSSNPCKIVISANGTNKVTFNVSVPTGADAVPLADGLMIAVGTSKTKDTKSLRFKQNYFYAAKNGTISITLPNVSYYTFSPYITDKKGNRINKYKVSMTFSQLYLFPLGINGATTPCGVNALKPCPMKITVVKQGGNLPAKPTPKPCSTSNVCVPAMACHGLGGQPVDGHCSKAGTICCSIK